MSASTIQGQTGVEVASAGTGEIVTDGPIETVGEPVELIVGDDVDVELAVEVDVDVDVDVEVEVGVFVDELDEDVFEGELVAEDAEVGAVDASFVGGVDVPDTIGVLEGSDGRLTEREVLGRFEPPPQAAMNTSEIAHSTLARDRMRLVRVVSVFTANDSPRLTSS